MHIFNTQEIDLPGVELDKMPIIGPYLVDNYRKFTIITIR